MKTTEQNVWYVMRYHMLTQRLKDSLEQVPFEIFHHYRMQKSVEGGVKQVPVLHGYVFAHAPFSVVKAYAREVGLMMMHDPFWEAQACDLSAREKAMTDSQRAEAAEAFEAKRYVRVSHAAMQPFMRAAELKAYDLEFFDTDIIDVEKDDLVEFVRGEMAGVKGYLKPGKGRNGGLVIVPLAAEGSTAVQGDGMRLSRLSYSLEAHQNDIAILAFARGNRHAKDCIFDLKPVVDAAFTEYVSTGAVDATMQEKLIGFVHRYGSAQVNTPTQASHHISLLYRINVILGNDTLCRELRDQIKTEVLPDLLRRRDAALKRGNPDAAEKHIRLLNELEETDKVLMQNISSRSGMSPAEAKFSLSNTER